MNIDKYIKKDKDSLFRAKTEGPKQIWVEGGYFKHINRTICPIGDELTELDIDHLIIQSGFSDWNMPRAVNCYHVIGGTVCEYTGRADEDGKKVFTKDIVKTGEGIGVIG